MSDASGPHAESGDLPVVSLANTSERIVSEWAAALICLGVELRRLGSTRPSLVLALTLPTLDLAALCIAAGWRLSGPSPSPVHDVGELAQGQSVHLLAGRALVADRFFGFAAEGTQIHVGKSRWRLDRGTLVFAADGLSPERYNRLVIPDPGALGRRFLSSDRWPRFHAVSKTQIAAIGTKSRLLDECQTLIGIPGEDGEDALEVILRPDRGNSAAWSLAIHPGSVDGLSDCQDAELLILEGPAAIGWLNEGDAPVTVCLIDRSAADESASETVIQARATSRPVDPEGVRWRPPPGIEMLVFERGGVT